jgi:stress-induced morphogen
MVHCNGNVVNEEEDDDEDDHEDVRQKVKEESQRILLCKGKQGAMGEVVNGCVMESEGEEEEFASKEEVVSLSDSVDSMLENVNRIMCKGGQGNVVEEIQMNGVLGDDHSPANGFPPLDAVPCAEEPMEWETAEMTPSGSQSSVNLEMNTKVVDWNDYSQQNNTLATTSHEEKRCEIKEEMRDSIFTNAFFSTATKTTSSLTHHRPVTITYSCRPRKNILTVSDKLFGKADKHKSRVQSTVLGDEGEVKGAVVDERMNGEQVMNGDQVVNGEMAEEMVHCNGNVVNEEEDDDEDDHEDVRQKVKEESQRILLCKGKQGAMGEVVNGCVMESEGEEEEFASKEEVVSLSDSVDSMLENVNRIMCKGGQGNVVEEIQMNGVLGDDHSPANGFPPLDAVPCAEEPMEWETAEMTPSGSQSSVNLEMNTKVVDWNDYSQQNNTLATTSHEEKRCEIKEEMRDSIFTNAFFSTATKTTSSLTHHRPVTITYSCRPRKNILTVSDKLFGKADKHKSRVQSTVLGDEGEVKGAVVDERMNGEQVMNGDQVVNGEMAEEMVHCNGNVVNEEEDDEELKEETTKKNLKNCVQENGDIEKVLPTEKLKRKLKYTDEKTIETVISNTKLKDVKSERECLACHVNNPTLETPMKHDESVCVNNNNNNSINNNYNKIRN